MTTDSDITRFFYDVRDELSLDTKTVEDAIETYKKLSSRYSLEGEQNEWIACALYVACRSSFPQSTTNRLNRNENNLISLSKILQACEISLVQFFKKMKNWSEMARLSSDMRMKIDKLETNFRVTTLLFRKYKPMFEHIFKCASSNNVCRFTTKNRKQGRKQEVSSLDVFTFCWTLFVYIKSKFSKISDDLVNSFHLLIVCLNYCYSSVLSFDNYQDIVNTSFYDHLSNKLKTDPRSHNNDNRVSIIELLCEEWHGIVIEAKQIEKHWFKSCLNSLIHLRSIRKRGNGIIDSDVIDFNYKFIKKEYENYVLNIGDFDECVFLSESADDELGVSETCGNDEWNIVRLKSPGTVIELNCTGQPNRLMPKTPLSSINYLGARTPVNNQLTPISCATSSIGRLHSILLGRTTGPSDDLKIFYSKCKTNVSEDIEQVLVAMGQVYLQACQQQEPPELVVNCTPSVRLHTDHYSQKQLTLAKTLFYNLLEKIMKGEMHRAQSNSECQLSRILERPVFIRSLFACSLEIILFSHNTSHPAFPWILDIFNKEPKLKIYPFYFYKIIEPIIREERGLSRELVKHLNAIEEKILEHLAWKKDSPLWAFLAQTPTPTCTQVSINIIGGDSPRSTHQFCNLLLNTYAHEPVDARCVRQLNFANSGSDTASQEQTDRPPVTTGTGEKPKSSYLSLVGQSPNPILSSVVIKPNTDCEATDGQTQSNNVTNSKVVAKVGHLGLFFRKVYFLASLRFTDLFSRLSINSDDLKLKIWTCFEHAMSKYTCALMCDRHLDQIIMCSIYSICKLHSFDDRKIAFQDLINGYRQQPQAVSSVYRQVLLSSRKMSSDGEPTKSPHTPTAQPGTPRTPAQPIIVSDSEKDRIGSVIEFYNQVFITNLTQAYIMRFGPRQEVSPTLSPMPPNRFTSPKIQSQVAKTSVYISPLNSTVKCLVSPNRGKSYRFQSNGQSSVDLREINSMMKSSTVNTADKNSFPNKKPCNLTKHLLNDDDMETVLLTQSHN